jgi:hypothetical protein
MENLREEVFEQVFRAGALRNVRLVMREGRTCISFMVGDGSEGVVMTKRGDLKQYRVETALVFLRRCGLAKVEVDMSSWAVDQPALI